MLRTIIINFVCLLQILPKINSQGYYSILAPNTIRPNSEYHVSVSVHQTSEPTTVKLGIISGSYSNFKTVEVRPFSSELVQFELLDIKPGSYSLTSEGVSGISFTNETKLQFQQKKLSVLVQTDKAIYKPGDLVRYRVLILDANTKPARNIGDVHIEIKDGDGNIIKRLANVQLTSSIYSDDLQLASQFPTLGEWSINTDVMGELHRKPFEVAEYVLPKYQVTIDTPKHALYKDGVIAVTIRAKSHYGKPIKGEATLSVYPRFYGAIQPFLFNFITRKVVSLDGKAYVEFDIKNELNFYEDYTRDILLEAIIEEQLTGRKQNTSTIISLHRDRYNIEAVRVPKFYVPNVPFEVLVKVVQHDGTSLTDSSNSITAYWTESLRDRKTENVTEFALNNQGLAKLRLTIPDNAKSQQLIIVSYLDVSTEIGMVNRKPSSAQESYIQATILNDRPTVNQEVNIAVQSSEPMKYFMYQLVGRGDIILSKTVNVPESNYHTFKFISNLSMVPKAKLLVYFIGKDGTMVFDEQIINFGNELSNFLRLEVPTQSAPGQEVDITITTKPLSYIGLMAVDQNAVNMRMGNDLNFESIFDELNKYDTDSTISKRGTPGNDAGLILMTNSAYSVNTNNPTNDAITTTVMMDVDGKLIKKTDIGPAHTFEVNTRPPLAGPYAFSRIPKPFWNRPRVHVRTDIMDTWLFMNISSGNEGRTIVHKKLPTAMASWVITGFSLDPVSGLGISKQSSNIEYFRTFYITTDLPYSIRKNEIIAVPFVVFNNQNRDIETEVTMYNTAQEFEFPHVSNELSDKPKIELYSRRTIRVPSNSAKSVSFMIRPKKLGHIIIKAVATSSLAGDTIERTLLVEPEGATEYINRGFFFDLRSKSEASENITIEIPKNSIGESTQIEVSVVGDVLGPAIQNLEKLILLPSGGGEQIMVNFVPNILVLKYLEKINKLSPAVEAKAKKYLEIGYQRLLFHRHSDGSFSSFGKATDMMGSTWLTAYAAKSLKQATQFTQIDESVIKSALTYLVNIQAEDGSFPEMGDVIYSQDMDGVSLTAFTLLAFLENSNNIAEYRNVINKAIDYIVRSLATSDDLYSLAISAYALSMAGHNSKNAFVQRLDTYAKHADGQKWWAKSFPMTEKSNPWYNKTRSTNVELSSYAALALLQNNLLTEALPILKWLVDQRTSMGGFVSSQDTVVGLKALIRFAEQLPNRDTNIQVVFGYGGGIETRMNVNDENSIILQSYQLSPYIRNMTITASGRGLALAQVSYKYNTNVTGAWPRFSLDPQVNRISHADYLHLSICSSFVPVAGGANQSNMAIMEVTLPSGFTVDLDTLPSLEAHNRIKKVETRKRDTIVIIYFDYLDRKEVCPTLDAYKTHKVTKHRAVPVILYDAYDSARRARIFYNAPKSTLCDICDGADCGSSCGPLEQRQSRGLNDPDFKKTTISDGNGGVGATTPAASLLIIFIVLTSTVLF